MDDRFTQMLEDDSDDHDDIQDIKDRLTAMEKYIYDIKVVQSFIPQIKEDIQANKNDIAQLIVSMKQISFYLGRTS